MTQIRNICTAREKTYTKLVENTVSESTCAISACAGFLFFAVLSLLLLLLSFHIVYTQIQSVLIFFVPFFLFVAVFFSSFDDFLRSLATFIKSFEMCLKWQIDQQQQQKNAAA